MYNSSFEIWQIVCEKFYRVVVTRLEGQSYTVRNVNLLKGYYSSRKAFTCEGFSLYKERPQSVPTASSIVPPVRVSIFSRPTHGSSRLKPWIPLPLNAFLVFAWTRRYPGLYTRRGPLITPSSPHNTRLQTSFVTNINEDYNVYTRISYAS